MKIQDLLRNLLDLVDGQEIVASQDQEQDTANTMVPPLQQNLELMKRAVDVPNFFDTIEQCSCAGCQSGESCCGEEEDDELDRIRTIAGIPTAAVITMANNQSFPSQG